MPSATKSTSRGRNQFASCSCNISWLNDISRPYWVSKLSYI
nr:MAG TPA: hypothetical protein [Caudoviricetes sp.]